MTGTKIIITSCHNTTNAKALMAWVDECGDIFEVEGELVVVDIEQEYVRSIIDAEVERLARRITKEAITKALPAFYAEEARQSHPKFQPNIKGFRK